jgi:hypothetical protein
VVLAASTPARAEGPECGFDCGDGVFTACNDDFPIAMVGGALVNCSASLGSCTGEAFCASFGDNFQASAYPLEILRIYIVAASNSLMDAAMQMDLELYQELGTPAPGPQIGSTINLAIAGSQTAATVVDFAGLGVPNPQIPTPGRFRICFRKQWDAQHNICLDDANPPSAYGRNWAHVRVAADPMNPCGSAIIGTMWYSADGTGSILPGFPGIMGDFIIRPDLSPADPAGIPGGGMCPDVDAGVEMDAGIAPADTGARDSGAPIDAAEDAGAADADPIDTGAPDTGDPIDAGDLEKDAGLLAPEVTAISPDRGKSDSSTDVTIIGRNFASPATVRIGAIFAAGVTVAGTSTILARVPQGIAVGIYDVIVTNPDGQAAILTDGFQVTGDPVSTGGSPPDDGCGCGASSHRGSTALIGLLLAACGMSLRRR